jgi:branched-chain amino acid transport system substrate-binding protein
MPPTRRQAIKLSSASFVGLAGCLSGDGDGNGSTPSDGSNGGTTTSSGDPVKLGSIQPMSGAFSGEGPYIRDSIAVAIEMINEDGGIDGREVEQINADTETDGEAASNRTRELINQEDVDFIVGGVSSGVSDAIMEIASQNGVVNLTGTGNTGAFKENCHQYAFPSSPHAKNLARGYFPNYVSESGGRSFFLINANYSYQNTQVEVYKDIINNDPDLELAGEASAEFGASDYSDQITAALNSDADSLQLCFFGQNAINIVNQLKQFGGFDRFDNVGLNWTSTTIFEGMNRVEGLYAAGHYNWNIDDELNNAFVQRYEEETGVKPAQFGGINFMAAQALLSAAQEAGSTDPDEVSQTLIESRFESPVDDGEYWWRECDHYPMWSMSTFRGKAPSERGHEADYVERLAVAQPEKYIDDCFDCTL